MNRFKRFICSPSQPVMAAKGEVVRTIYLVKQARLSVRPGGRHHHQLRWIKQRMS